ncbi:hypothetical protein JYQ62_04405 [Nostoc sp. UHCC 0702]|nr:hypothetical protein JYQ62_04405 [Nostoc sp. UHCC 0702]
MLLSDSIKLSLNEFYIYQFWENVTEPTDGEWGLGTGDWGMGTGDWGLGTRKITSSSP